MQITPIKPLESINIFNDNKNVQQDKISSFEDFLRKAVYDVSDSKKYADKLNESYIKGELENMHDLTIAQAQSSFKFQALVEVNNKLIDAYKEITRIQI